MLISWHKHTTILIKHPVWVPLCLKCYLVFPFRNCLDVLVLNRLNRSVGLYKSTRGTLQCVHTDVKLSSVSSKSKGYQKIVGKHVGLETLSDFAFKIPSFLYNIFVWYDFVLHRLRSIVPSVYNHTRVHMHLHWCHVKGFHLKKECPNKLMWRNWETSCLMSYIFFSLTVA